METNFDEDAARRKRWAQRKIEMRQRKRRQELFRKLAVPGLAVSAVLIIAIVIAVKSGQKETVSNKEADTVKTQETVIGDGSVEDGSAQKTDINAVKTAAEAEADSSGNEPEEFAALKQTGAYLDQIAALEQANEMLEKEAEDTAADGTAVYHFNTTEDTISLGENVVSSNAIFVDLASQTVLARKDETSRIVPASMTKVLTLLVAVEHIDDLDDTFVMTREILDYCYINDCVVVGFEEEESVTVKDMLYGMVLHSGADAAIGLAEFIAGSQEEFMKLMNAKLEELGLSDSAHFTNCTGIYEEGHYCSAYDMAVIMAAAVKNKTCREVLSAHTYTTAVTAQHPEGITISNWFLRRIEDKDTGGEVICAKTGYVLQSGNCAVSFGMDKKGREYICVTVNAYNKWKCTEDHVRLYKQFSQKV